MPRITIGDGSLYIETHNLTSWEISAEQIVSPTGHLALNRVGISVNGETILQPIPVERSIEIGFGGSALLTIQQTETGSKVSIAIEGGSFADDRWQAVGNDILFFNAKGVHIDRVIIDDRLYYPVGEHSAPHHRLPFLERLRRRTGCCITISAKAVKVAAAR